VKWLFETKIGDLICAALEHWLGLVLVSAADVD
jgi:hypothetical protein